MYRWWTLAVWKYGVKLGPMTFVAVKMLRGINGPAIWFFEVHLMNRPLFVYEAI